MATSPTTTSSKPDVPFTASANDVITQLNLQLPILMTGESPTNIPVVMREPGVFGGPVKPGVEIYLRSSGNAFSPLLATVVRVTGVNGTVQAPARLLSGVGVSHYALSPDVIDAFREDALPHLSAVSRTRTTLTVGTYYDLTIVVLETSSIAFIFTPVGVSPPPGVENLGA
ncbi:hypothetical protein ACFFQW_48765 [Umezawaea endophytica]|uniref:Uncharacterized protein n=1 Tax=Umezawaea endophytica TaxID=1654476 RepID=A0A9X2VX82_9PSEU|nr:hypothetical protein [Umezawaea endophytica]MCS7484062.1 hypothetical protein [Umezawaea endophytica]